MVVLISREGTSQRFRLLDRNKSALLKLLLQIRTRGRRRGSTLSLLPLQHLPQSTLHECRRVLACLISDFASQISEVFVLPNIQRRGQRDPHCFTERQPITARAADGHCEIV